MLVDPELSSIWVIANHIIESLGSCDCMNLDSIPFVESIGVGVVTNGGSLPHRCPRYIA